MVAAAAGILDQGEALTMAWTQADIDTLKAAIVDRKGARSIAFADQVVTFETVEDMLKLLAAMEQEVAAAAGRSTRSRFAATSKGTR